MNDDLFQMFLIEADLAGRFLQEGAVSRLTGPRGYLDYSRSSLPLAARALDAVFRGEILYLPEAALIHAAQYLGETIRQQLRANWALRGETIELVADDAQGNTFGVDVFGPCVAIAEAARQGKCAMGEISLVNAFDSAILRSR